MEAESSWRRDSQLWAGSALFSIWRRLQCHLAAGIGFGARHLTSQQTPKLPTSGRD
jgi:hypothetical protein